jgi:hypothetical protein
LGAHDGGARAYSALMASLLRYPEIASVALDPFARLVRTEFLVRRPLAEEERRGLLEEVREALDTWAALEARVSSLHEARVLGGEGGPAVVRLTWKAPRLDPGEVNLVAELMRERLGSDLLVDEEPMRSPEESEEEVLAQGEELIAEKLASLSPLWGGRSVVAFRDEGRLVVYPR